MPGPIRHNLFKDKAAVTTPEAQCEGKQRFASVDDIAKALRRTGHKYNPYRCPYCQGWHVGGGISRGTRRKRIAK